MSTRTHIAIAGFGNIGRGVFAAVKKNSDMEVSAIITRRPEIVKKELRESGERDILVVLPSAIEGVSPDVPLFMSSEVMPVLPTLNVVVLCGGSKEDLFGKEGAEERNRGQGPYFAERFTTVCSFDTHKRVPEYFAVMGRAAEKGNNVALISAGWDPGTFSLERVLADAFLPGASHYTFWGHGVSQGHSDAVRKIEGVLDARQYTLPVEAALEAVRQGRNPILTTRQKHTRQVYVVAKSGADSAKIERKIKEMPNYFADYDTEVKFISAQEMAEKHSKFPHGGFVMTTGETGRGSQARIEYSCQWQNNPEATGSILVACARAAHRLSREGKSGAFTMLDVPPAYYSPRSQEELLREFM
jgi:diaminopimelate dehydrogenase